MSILYSKYRCEWQWSLKSVFFLILIYVLLLKIRKNVCKVLIHLSGIFRQEVADYSDGLKRTANNHHLSLFPIVFAAACLPCEKAFGFFEIHGPAWNGCSSAVTCRTLGITSGYEMTGSLLELHNVFTVRPLLIWIKTRHTLMPSVALPPFNRDYICWGCSACHRRNYSTVPLIKSTASRPRWSIVF